MLLARCQLFFLCLQHHHNKPHPTPQSVNVMIARPCRCSHSHSCECGDGDVSLWIPACLAPPLPMCPPSICLPAAFLSWHSINVLMPLTSGMMHRPRAWLAANAHPTMTKADVMLLYYGIVVPSMTRVWIHHRETTTRMPPWAA